jgi:L-amino acid N-acyltransferase YncA
MEVIDCGRSHSPEILAILNEAILNSTALYDYKERTLEMMGSWFDAKDRDSYPVIGVVDRIGQLLGFGSYGPFRSWPAYKYTVEHSLYVHSRSRGQGIGRKILNQLIVRAKMQEYHNIVGGIDAENKVSIRLHKSLGFEYCGRIRHAGFKFGKWLDLEFYQLILETPSYPVDE